MIKTDLHTHTLYCDGKDTPAAMAEAAFTLGMDCLGFSGHSFIEGQEDWCMTPERAEKYRSEVEALKEKYDGRLMIFCGVEQDMVSKTATDIYDYVIASQHVLDYKGMQLLMDESAAELRRIVKDVFDGDSYAMAEAYFSREAELLERIDGNIIGHFDLLTKFNEEDRLFDTEHPRYIEAWQKAADRLLRYRKPFEINTGAISRGYRSTPYPDDRMIAYISKRGGTFVLSSDSHSKDTLCYRFEEMGKYLKNGAGNR